MAAPDSIARVLVVAGSDSSGGSGIQRDLAVLAEEGVRAACAVTAVTAQSDAAVHAIHPVPVEVVEAQLRAAFEGPVDAVKVGMLGRREVIKNISYALRDTELPMVVDPVMVSSSGKRLLDEDARAALLEELCPLAALVTPNLSEAAAMLGEDVAAGLAMQEEQAQRLAEMLGTAVLLKGGHASGPEAVDVLARPGETRVRLAVPRSPGSRRGTGCALSSRIAAQLARGVGLEQACRRAQAKVAAAIAATS